MRTSEIVGRDIAINKLIRTGGQWVDFVREWEIVKVTEYLQAGCLAGIDHEGNDVTIETGDIIRIF